MESGSSAPQTFVKCEMGMSQPKRVPIIKLLWLWPSQNYDPNFAYSHNSQHTSKQEAKALEKHKN